MTLSDLSGIGSLVSGVAVLISLAYLAQQIRQSASNQRAAVHQGRSATIGDLLIRLAEPSLARTFSRAASGDRDIPAEEFYQYLNLLGAMLMGWEDHFDQHNAGMLSDDRFFSTNAGIAAVLQQPGHRAAWKVYAAPLFARDFRTFVEERIAEGLASAPRDVFADWKAELTTETKSAAARTAPSANG